MLQSMEGNPFDDKIRVRGSCMYVPKSMEGGTLNSGGVEVRASPCLRAWRGTDYLEELKQVELAFLMAKSSCTELLELERGMTC